MSELRQGSQGSPVGPSGDDGSILSAQLNPEALSSRWLVTDLKRSQCDRGTVILILLNFH